MCYRSPMRDQRFGAAQTDRQLHDLEIVQQRERFLAPCDLESEGRAKRRIEGPHRSIHNIMRIISAAGSCSAVTGRATDTAHSRGDDQTYRGPSDSTAKCSP